MCKNVYEVFLNNESKLETIVADKYFRRDEWIHFVDNKDQLIDSFQEYLVNRIKVKR